MRKSERKQLIQSAVKQAIETADYQTKLNWNDENNTSMLIWAKRWRGKVDLTLSFLRDEAENFKMDSPNYRECFIYASDLTHADWYDKTCEAIDDFESRYAELNEELTTYGKRKEVMQRTT